MSSRQAEKEERRRQERLAPEQAERRAAARRRRMQLAGGAAVVIGAALVVVVLVTGGGGGSKSSSGPPARSGLLATTSGEPTGARVDGIPCQSVEQVLFHIHAHLAVYVNGRQAQIPEGIGIPRAQVQQTAGGPFASAGSCLYWLHSHTRDGVIHIESPVRRTYTLGNYFDIWKQPLGRDGVGPARGGVTEYVDGKRFTGAPASTPLRAHELIQLDVGAPVVKPQPYTFAQGL
jgi:hypothetical protein